MEITPPSTAAAELGHEQPPEVKLRLGHYSNPARGIGVTIDRTSELSPRRPHVAKLRYDGTVQIHVLEATPGTRERVDYLAGRMVVMHVYDNGRIELYVDRIGPISVSRDGDAEPL